jgi:hypothetical protein
MVLVSYALELVAATPEERMQLGLDVHRACAAGRLFQWRQLDRLNCGHLTVVEAAPHHKQCGEDGQDGEETHY